jgi:hypothetical protein
MHNGLFWQNQFEIEFIPANERIASTFLNRLLPSFNSIDEEAEKYAKKIYNEFCSRADPEGDADPSIFAENAHEAGINYFSSMIEFKQGLCNVAVVMLYHCFEQHLMLFHRKELLSPQEENEKNLLCLLEIKKRLQKHGIDIEKFPIWNKIEELRCLVNTIKHGQGVSSAKLFKKRPDLFQSPSIKELCGIFESKPSHSVFTPLLGDDIYVQKGDIVAYANTITEFWKELGKKII